MSFIPVNYDSGKLRRLPANAETFVRYAALLDDGSGFLTAATSGSTEVRYVCMDPAVIATDGDLLLVLDTQDVLFEADTDANPAQTDVGTYADLASSTTVNPDASSNDVFYIERIVGVVGDRRVAGKFVHNIS